MRQLGLLRNTSRSSKHWTTRATSTRNTGKSVTRCRRVVIVHAHAVLSISLLGSRSRNTRALLLLLLRGLVGRRGRLRVKCRFFQLVFEFMNENRVRGHGWHSTDRKARRRSRRRRRRSGCSSRIARSPTGSGSIIVTKGSKPKVEVGIASIASFPVTHVEHIVGGGIRLDGRLGRWRGNRLGTDRRRRHSNGSRRGDFLLFPRVGTRFESIRRGRRFFRSSLLGFLWFG